MQHSTIAFISVAAMFISWSGKLGHQFQVVRKLPTGEKVSEWYTRSEDGKRLFVIIKREGGPDGTRQTHRAYQVKQAA